MTTIVRYSSAVRSTPGSPVYRMTWNNVAFIAKAAGFSGQALRVVIALAEAESARNPESITVNYKREWFPDGPFILDPTGARIVSSTDRGTWQFSDKWHDEVTDDQAFNPWTCAQEVFRVSKQGTNFKAWAAYTGWTKPDGTVQPPPYLAYMTEAETAAEWVEAGHVALLQVKVEGRTPLSPGICASQLGIGVQRLIETNGNRVRWPAVPGTSITIPRWVRPARLFAGPR